MRSCRVALNVWGSRLVFGAVIGLAGAAFAQDSAADAGVWVEDQQLLEEISAATAEPFTGSPVSQVSGDRRGANPFSNFFNPALSLNGLLLGSATTGGLPDGTRAGLSFQELELQLTANVDPYLSANAVLSIPGLEGLEVEEAFLTALPQPLGLSLRAGKVRLPFGRENPLHTHGLPFVDRSLVNSDVFGPEGLSEVVAEAAWLAPLPWYTLLTVSVLDGANEALFGSPQGSDLAAAAALRMVFDVSDDATVEAGASYALGRNVEFQLAQALGAHLVFRWRPARDAINSSAMLTLEAIVARRPNDPSRNETPSPDTGGCYAEAQWQLTRGWYLGARAEFLGHRGLGSGGDSDMTLRQSAIVVFAPTEFSAFRLQGNVVEPPGGEPVIEGYLQANFTIGAHPAHSY